MHPRTRFYVRRHDGPIRESREIALAWLPAVDARIEQITEKAQLIIQQKERDAVRAASPVSASDGSGRNEIVFCT